MLYFYIAHAVVIGLGYLAIGKHYQIAGNFLAAWLLFLMLGALFSCWAVFQMSSTKLNDTSKQILLAYRSWKTKLSAAIYIAELLVAIGLGWWMSSLYLVISAICLLMGDANMRLLRQDLIDANSRNV